MSVLVVGSVALDTLTTPAGKVEDTLGGSAVYFGLAAGQLSRVRIVGVVGPDFPSVERSFLQKIPAPSLLDSRYTKLNSNNQHAPGFANDVECYR